MHACRWLPGLSNDFCSDNTAYHCSCGYLMGSTVCGDCSNNCVTVDSYDGWDKVSGPFAECGLPPSGREHTVACAACRLLLCLHSAPRATDLRLRTDR